MNTKEKSKASLEIKRIIKAPRERVYAAWTDPAQLKQWFGPPSVKTRNLTAEPRPGGKFQWDLTSPDGEPMTVQGKYLELQPGRKVVFTWQWEDDEAWSEINSIVTIELSDHESGTELHLKHEQLPSEESRDRHNDGWSRVLDNLEVFINH